MIVRMRFSCIQRIMLFNDGMGYNRVEIGGYGGWEMDDTL